ncbi:hypothetical protein GFB85_21365 [Escherichia coli]|nr:hypothetical protein [Escherichia coli]NBY79353.1 hypothetical protein [Escherichia coli]NBZ02587.1 hypothetical protein [Escherichia coli]NBZ04661.1 hypothetical protein [Escherichia coli]NBZ68810.1 hypothetical protein [Escherichia coli]
MLPKCSRKCGRRCSFVGHPHASRFDTPKEGLTHILSEHFENVKTKVQGTVVMFSASGKK